MFDKAFNDLMVLEGGDAYSNTSGDYPTRFGISEPVARENGYTGPMQMLPIEVAKAIYKKKYWDRMCLDTISVKSYPIAFELFEAGVNLGTVIAVGFVQRAVNCCGSYLLIVDGVMGSKTLSALDQELQKRNEHLIYVMQNAQQCLRYMEIAETQPQKRKFFDGWIKNRVIL